MSGTVLTGGGPQDAWTAAGWLYRWVLDRFDALPLTPAGRDLLVVAAQVSVLDLAEFPPADRSLVRAACGPPLVEAFEAGLRAGYDPAAAVALLQELGRLVDGVATPRKGGPCSDTVSP